jgi:hypothetical protein
VGMGAAAAMLPRQQCLFWLRALMSVLCRQCEVPLVVREAQRHCRQKRQRQ